MSRCALFERRTGCLSDGRFGFAVRFTTLAAAIAGCPRRRRFRVILSPRSSVRLTDFHAKYLAAELTRRYAADSLEKLAPALASTSRSAPPPSIRSAALPSRSSSCSSSPPRIRPSFWPRSSRPLTTGKTHGSTWISPMPRSRCSAATSSGEETSTPGLQARPLTSKNRVRSRPRRQFPKR